MDSHLFLFTGANREELLREKTRWIDQFKSKHGDSDLLTTTSKDIVLRDLIDHVAAAPFLADKRLVIVDGIPRCTTEEMERLAKSIHPKVVLVFIEAEPDGRLSSVKTLQKIANVKTFEPKTGKALRTFLMEETKKAGTTIDPAALEKLIDRTGEDEAMLASEIHKLALYAGSRSISVADVLLLGVPGGEQEVWELSRLLAEGDARAALAYTKGLLARGEDAHSIWNILLWIVRQFVATWSCAQEGTRNPADIARKMHVPFPSARTLLPAASRAKPEHIRALLDEVSQNDIALKTGGYRSTAESPEEVLALLDLLLLKMAGVMKG